MAASMSSSGSTSATHYNVKNIFDGDMEDTGATGMAWSGDNKVDPWVELDLGEIQQVYEVQVYDRGDLGTQTTPLGFFEVALFKDGGIFKVRSGYPRRSVVSLLPGLSAWISRPPPRQVACNSHTAASQEGTADTPISLSCRGFARYVVVTLPGSGRSLALREIDVFAVENADGTPCLTEFFPGAPPPPPLPPAVPGYVPVDGYEPLPYTNCNCGPGTNHDNRLGPGPEKQAPIGESTLADGTVLVADPSYSTPERCAEFCSATPGCKAFGIWTGTPGEAPGCSYGPWSLNPTVLGMGDGTDCLCVPFVAKCTRTCTAPTGNGFTNLLYNLIEE